MRMNLLQLVQEVLSDIDSDPVNVLDETPEAEQVARLIRASYFDLISVRDWPFLNTLGTLTTIGDSGAPHTLTIPSTVNKVLWLKYNKKEVCFLEPKDFQDMLDLRTETAGHLSADGYYIDSDPVYWTSFDDTTATFDGYDSSSESWLQGSNSMVYAARTPAWVGYDGDFEPELPEKMFPTFLADCKSRAFLILKQTANPLEASAARKGRIRFQKEATRVEAAEKKTNSSINYGRRR